MSIANYICQLAAEFADEVEQAPTDHFRFEMKATFFEWDQRAIEPVTLTFSALWTGDEWKWTKRERLETWEPVLWERKK